MLVGLHSQGATGVAARHAIDRPNSIIHDDFVPGGAVGPDDLALVRVESESLKIALTSSIRSS